jgi:hypothetical protein
MAKDITKPKGVNPKSAKRKPPQADLNMDGGNVLRIGVSGDYSRIIEASGNSTVSDGLVGQLASLGSNKRSLDAGATDFALGFIDSMKPRDAAEALLAAQMAAIHNATMMMARRLNHVENIPQQDAAERALNKLARTFTAQMDTLKRYRSKGQTVRVERVTVESGGQAIVGPVSHGRADTPEK